ncbi:hypothetical protein [Methylobacterium sp. ID0610]|uniref:hypothetical protein n=1 Tax=Methylobacterium carpenticola TaxID=3344827 RepID=UPI00367BB31F
MDAWPDPDLSLVTACLERREQGRIARLPEATHWRRHGEPERVATAPTGFPIG